MLNISGLSSTKHTLQIKNLSKFNLASFRYTSPFAKFNCTNFVWQTILQNLQHEILIFTPPYRKSPGKDRKPKLTPNIGQCKMSSSKKIDLSRQVSEFLYRLEIANFLLTCSQVSCLYLQSIFVIFTCPYSILPLPSSLWFNSPPSPV